MTKLSQLPKIALIFVVSTGFALPGLALSEQSLGQLEHRFFFHDYARDTVEDRLSRLERMVFGQARTGSADQRMSQLAAAVATAGGATIASKPAAPAATAAKPTPKPIPQEVASDDDAPAPSAASNYPAIVAIERKILGKSFVGEPAMKRIERLEKSVFGKAGSGLLVDRVDRLKDRTGIDIAMQDPGAREWADEDDADEPPRTASRREVEPEEEADSGVWEAPTTPFATPRQQRTANRPVAVAKKTAAVAKKPSPTVAYPPAAPPLIAQANVPPPAPPPRSVAGWTGPEAAPSVGVVRQLSSLEYRMFGRIYSDALTARISRLESAVFPMQNTPRSQPLSQRISRLLRAVQAAAPAVPLAQGRMHRPTVPHNQPLFNLP
jgi:hypothetical protein